MNLEDKEKYFFTFMNFFAQKQMNSWGTKNKIHILRI